MKNKQPSAAKRLACLRCAPKLMGPIEENSFGDTHYRPDGWKGFEA
jgi:hypothetical protein